MILEIDLGNSRIKWRLRDDSGRLAGGTAGHDELPQVADELAALGGAPDEVWVASVLAEGRDADLSAWCERLWRRQPRFARTQARCAGVTNGYRDPSQLGVDRWLALVAARQACAGPVVVVQAGTAITVDLLGADGVHLGGYIGPGWQLMRRALNSDTARVRAAVEPPERLMLEPGRDTVQAVEAAIASMALGLVRQGRERLPAGPAQTLVAGGDGPLLLEHLPGARLVPELVLDGLAPVISAGRAPI